MVKRGHRVPYAKVAITTLVGLIVQPALPQNGPFAELHNPPDVITSRNEEGIWFGLEPTAYNIRLPVEFENRTSATHGQRGAQYQPALRIHCRRSGPESHELGFRSDKFVEIVIPRLEGDPMAALAITLLDLRYWYYEITGQAVREVSMEVSIDGGVWSPTALRIHRTDYSAPRPQLYAYLPERTVLEMIAAGRSWEMEGRGEEAAFVIEFPPGSAPVQTAARGLLELCVDGG